MLVKSPMKKKKTKQNRRKPSGRKGRAKKKSRKSSGSHGRRSKRSKLSLPRVEPWKIILGVVIVGLLGMAYLNHVFATQELLAEVQKKEQQYNQVKRSHDSYRLMYDRMIGPAEISAKAKRLGFINGGPAEKVIEVAPE
jgi:hypothetical protein